MTTRRHDIPQGPPRRGAALPVAVSVLGCLLVAALAQQDQPPSDGDEPKTPPLPPMAWLRTAPPVDDETILEAIAKGGDFLAGRVPAGDTVLGRSLRLMQALTDDPAADVAADVAWLVDQQLEGGGWGFGPDHAHTREYPAWSDLGNTQLAVAALRGAADAGADVPDGVFARARQYCIDSQNDDGGWGFSPLGAEPLRLRGATHGSMTAAGLNVLVDCPLPDDEDADSQLQPVARGLRWLLDNYDVKQVPNWQWNRDDEPIVAYLWLLGRLAERSGIRNLGDHCVRDDVVSRLLAGQNADGSWGRGDTAVVDTALAVAALSWARRPVLVNRLSLLNDYGVETINWVRHMSAASGRPIGWQRIGRAMPPGVLAEAPILLIVTEDEVDLPPHGPGLLLRFLEDGGTIVVQISKHHSDSVERAAEYFDDMLPSWYDKPLSEFPAAMSAGATVAPQAIEGAIGIGDDVRLAVVVLPGKVYDDLSAGPGDETADAFALMTNLAVLASGSARPAGRLPYVPHEPPVSFAPSRGVPVARVWHSGDWYVCPHAFDRVSDTMAAAISIGASELPPEDLYKPVAQGRPLLWMTGTQPTKLTKSQRENLLPYLQNGGMLVMESAVGNEDFNYVNKVVMEGMFGAAGLQRLPDDHPLITGEFGGGMGSDLTSVTYTDAVTDPPAGVELYGITVNGKLAVIISPYGILASAEGAPAFGDKSLATDDARRLAANILLYVLAGGQ